VICCRLPLRSPIRRLPPDVRPPDVTFTFTFRTRRREVRETSRRQGSFWGRVVHVTLEKIFRRFASPSGGRGTGRFGQRPDRPEDGDVTSLPQRRRPHLDVPYRDVTCAGRRRRAPIRRSDGSEEEEEEEEEEETGVGAGRRLPVIDLQTSLFVTNPPRSRVAFDEPPIELGFLTKRMTVP